MAISQSKLAARRRNRVRYQLKRVSGGRPRLSVHRTNQHMYAQIIDDGRGITLVSASTLDPVLRDKVKAPNKEGAALVGKLVADRALAAGVVACVFDRGAFLFHGRVKALADAAREAGLKF